MLNSVLRMLDRYAVFDAIGPEKTQTLILEMLKEYPRNYDCNAGEILEGLAERFGVCYHCGGPAREFRNKMCVVCDEKLEQAWASKRQEQS